MKRRGNISLKLVADMCVKAGFDHLLTVDLHSKESQGFFSCRMDNLRAAPFFLQYVTENIPDYQNAVIVARNPISARRATSFADRLKAGWSTLIGRLVGIRMLPALLCHKNTAQGTQNPLLGIFLAFCLFGITVTSMLIY